MAGLAALVGLTAVTACTGSDPLAAPGSTVPGTGTTAPDPGAGTTPGSQPDKLPIATVDGCDLLTDAEAEPVLGPVVRRLAFRRDNLLGEGTNLGCNLFDPRQGVTSDVIRVIVFPAGSDFLSGRTRLDEAQDIPGIGRAAYIGNYTQPDGMGPLTGADTIMIDTGSEVVGVQIGRQLEVPQDLLLALGRAALAHYLERAAVSGNGPGTTGPGTTGAPRAGVTASSPR